MDVRGVIFDVDGTLVRGDEPIPGAAAGLDAAEAAGLRRLFVSNNPTKPPEAYEARLARAGIHADADEVLTAGTVTARYLLDRHAADSIAVVGEPGLVDLLGEAGLSVERVGRDGDLRVDPAVLVASLDRRFGYEMLRACLDLLADGDVAFVGTDPDVVIPAAEGDVPGSGAIVDAIANVAGREPAAVLGKPSETAREMALNRLDLPPEDVLVVGDRLDTDIALGARSGMTTALVTTGVTAAEDVASSPITPDYVLDSLAELEPLLAEP
ncbi:HAD-IIA family hydrolase [Halobellus sp. EA9]|uniref:HAD-IIA family hydrolase n=1 Tax=Halobellus sp. EA9 TaxID=3421647 RepID=UPI003EBA3294